MNRALAALAVALALGVAVDGAAKPRPRRGGSTRAAAAHDSVGLLATVRDLADPRFEGRGPGTAGLDSAAAYIAREMARLGLRPGGEAPRRTVDDLHAAFNRSRRREGKAQAAGRVVEEPRGYFQTIDVTTGVEVGSPCAIEAGGTRHEAGGQLQPLGFSTNGTLRAPVVFAGYGITAPGFEYDDYAGLDVHDKLVLVMTNEPGEMDSSSRFDGSINTPHAELRTKAIVAREHGALGLLVVNGPRYHAGEPLRKPRTDGVGYMTSGLLAVQVSEEVANALLRSSGVRLETLQEAIDGHGRPHSMPLGTGLSTPGSGKVYDVFDRPESATVTVTLKRTRTTVKNVVGWIPGRDTTRTLVIGAHYDHLGYGSESSLAPDTKLAHLGADDNASGVAALLYVAGKEASAWRSGRAPVHNLVFAAFTGEEMGLVGSSHFTDQPTRPLETVEAMLNMDMVGRLRDNRLLVMGAGTAAEFSTLLENVNRAAGFTLKTSSDGFGPSDHSSFYRRKIPVLALFTGAHADYHKPSDTWDKINGAGLARIAAFATAVVETLDARPRVAYLQARADSSMGRIAGGGGYGAYLGTIPDYLQTEGGVLLSGVRPGGPAEQAGIRAGDTIVKFDGVRIDNIYDYTYALRSRKPGQGVRITVKRGSGELDLLATLGRRP